MTDNSKFKKPNGELTPYAFACGYQQIHDNQNGYSCTLYQDGVYHLKIFSPDNRRLSWTTYDTMTQARRAYRKAIHAINTFEELTA